MNVTDHMTHLFTPLPQLNAIALTRPFTAQSLVGKTSAPFSLADVMSIKPLWASLYARTSELSSKNPQNFKVCFLFRFNTKNRPEKYDKY